jgi:hypothetical protein
MENTAKNDIHIFPNPTKGTVTIDFGSRVSDVEITVLNLLGQELYRNTYAADEIIRLDLSGPAGVYTVNVTRLGENNVFKVIKQ